MAESSVHTESFFLVIKLSGHDRAGKVLDARSCANALLSAGFWPLWSHTKCRNLIQAGDRIAVYLAGHANMCVIAHATVDRISSWRPDHARRYPLTLDGEADRVLELGSIVMLEQEQGIRELLPDLSFYRAKAKWGTALIGGMRSLTSNDFALLTGQQPGKTLRK